MASRCILFAVLAVVAAGKKPQVQTYTKPDLVAELPAATKVGTAARPCLSYAWAAALESMLRPQGVTFTQQQWVERRFGGPKCIDRDLDYAALARSVTGDYTLADGKRVRIEAEFTPGAPESADPLITGVAAGRLFMLIWKGRPYLLAGLRYDEQYSQLRRKYYILRELKLVDPGQPENVAQRHISFIRDKDDTTQLQGMMTVSVKERGLYDMAK